MRKLIYIGLVMTGFAFQGHSQQVPLYNQYFINPFALSPAFAGHNSNFETFLDYRKNWTGISDAPEVKMMSMNGPLIKNMGIGGTLLSDQIGIFRGFGATLAYSYKLKIDENQNVRFGIEGGVYENHVSIGADNDAYLNDPVVQNNINARAWMGYFKAGINYSYRRLNVGVVIPQLFESKMNRMGSDTALYSMARHYVGYVTYSYNITDEWSIRPMSVVRTTASSPLSYEFACLVRYKKDVWLGVNYRKGGATGISLGGIPYHRIALNYTYEFGTGGIMASSNGSHEISVGILFGSNKNNISSIFNEEGGSRKRPYLDWDVR